MQAFEEKQGETLTEKQKQILQKKNTKEMEKRKRKKNIVAMGNADQHNPDVFENFEEISYEMTSKDIDFIINSLKDNFLFANLKDTEFEEVISNMIFARVQQGSYIFKQNDKASCFFIIKEGIFAVEIDGGEKKVLERGASFGELALLYNAPRSASLKALTNSFVWCLKRSIFKKVLKEMNNKEKSEIKQILSQVKILQGMTEAQIDMLSLNIVILRYHVNEVIVNKGDQADSYYMIKEGEVGCYDGDKFIRPLVEGESFGEQALYQNGVRSLTVKATKPTQCLAISRETLMNVFGSDIETISLKNQQNWALENDDVFRRLNKLQIYKIINNSSIVSLKQETIMQKKR